jgi:hypothetical protein
VQKADEVIHLGHITAHHQAAYHPVQDQEVPSHQDLRQDLRQVLLQVHIQDLHPHLILQEEDNLYTI